MDKKDDRPPRGKAPDRDRRRQDFTNETNRMDPHSVRCRIFIGNLASEKISRMELEGIFSKYGHISGCSLHNNYGFVQFDNEKAADEAVSKEDGSMILGKKVDVHLVSDKRRKGPPLDNRDIGRGGMRPGGRGERDRPSPPRDRGRMDDYGGGRFPSRFDDGPFRRGPSPPRRDGFREPFDRPDDYHRDRYRDNPYDRRDAPPRRMYDDRRDYDYPPPRGDARGDPYDRDFRRDDPRRDDFRYDGPMRDEPRRDDYRRDGPRRDEPYGSRFDNYGRDDFGPPPKKSRPENENDYSKPIQAPIDCVVIVVNSVLMDYGTMVERKFKDTGLMTDLQLLGMRSMAELLDNITRHGVLYAAVVTTQHEVHRSVTINILHGTQQEHRNMPLEDALRLVSQNFDQYMQELRKRAGAGELDKDKDKERERERERELEREKEREKERARELEREKEREKEKNYANLSNTSSQEPDDIKKLLGRAATGGSLSSDELSKLIETLSKQKKQTESQGNQSASGPSTSQHQTDTNSIAKQQADLQAKIFSILNPSAFSKALTVAQSVTGTIKASGMSSQLSTVKTGHLSNPTAPIFPAAKAIGSAPQQKQASTSGYGAPKAPVPSWYSTPSKPSTTSYGNSQTQSSGNYGAPKAAPSSYGVPKASPAGFGGPKTSPGNPIGTKPSPSYGVPKASPTSYGVPKQQPQSFGVPKASPTNFGPPKPTVSNSYGVSKQQPGQQAENTGYGTPSTRGAPSGRGAYQGPGRGGVARGGPPPGATAVRGAAPPSARGARGGAPFQARAPAPRASAPRGPAPRGPTPRPQAGGPPSRGFPPRGSAGVPRYGMPFRGPRPQGAPISTVSGRGRPPPRY